MRLLRTGRFVLPFFGLLLIVPLFVGPVGAAARPGRLISGPDGSLFLLYDGARHAADSPTLAALGIDEQQTSVVSQRTLEAIPLGDPVPVLGDGTLIAGPDGRPALLFAGLHPIPDDDLLATYGWAGLPGRFDATPLVTLPDGLLAQLAPGAPVVAPEAGRRGPGSFDWGYCTWWIAQRRTVTWLGNAEEWLGNAQAQGYATGDRPAPGAILVRRSATATGYGHVAYVESVEGTRFTVSEMNVVEIGALTTRTYDMVSDPPPGLIGFIYWRYGDAPDRQPTSGLPFMRDQPGRGTVVP